MAIMDDILTKEARKGLVGSPLEAGSVHMIYLKHDSFFRVERKCKDFKVGARIKASKAQTFEELRAAVEQCQAVEAKYVADIYAKHGVQF